MARRPVGIEWGIGGEFEWLGAECDTLCWPCDGEAYEAMRARRGSLISSYAAWLALVGRDQDARCVSGISHGRWWPAVIGDTIWLEPFSDHREQYTPSHVIPARIFAGLGMGKLNGRDMNVRWYEHVIDAILDMARAAAAVDIVTDKDKQAVVEAMTSLDGLHL